MRVFKLILIFFLVQQINAVAQPNADSNNLPKFIIDSSITDSNNINIKSTHQSTLNKLLAANQFINLRQNPVAFVTQKKQVHSKEYLFYLFSSLILAFGLFKVFYARYFHHIFRVFFNTSLRQNQLTDLLLQARLPSLIFNIFFSITGGLYVWLLLTHYYIFTKESANKLLFFCIVTVSVIYIIKFCVLKFIGWITDMDTALNTYIFVIFLINKIIGVTLIPFIVFLAFAPPMLFKGTVIFSSLVLGSFFIIRFFRSYSLLQYEIHFSRVHFLLYIISLEILPMLVIYKLSVSVFLKI